MTDGWRYASRTETEALLDSLWGATEDLAADNFDGAQWFMSNFGVGSAFGAGLAFGYSSGGGSFWNFMFGATGECGSLLQTCTGQVRIEDLSFASIPANSTFGFNVGQFTDARGLSTGVTPDNINASHPLDVSSLARGSLLVRAVPAPSQLALLLFGLILLFIPSIRERF